MTLPVAPHWFRATPLDETVTVIVEPHVHVVWRANMFFVRGRDRDLLVDTGMGVAPLAPVVERLRRAPELVTVLTHAHVDHMGGAHEFADRLIHPAEAGELARPSRKESLYRDEVDPGLLDRLARMGYPVEWDMLIDAAPNEGYDLRGYVLRGAAPTGTLAEGDTVDLGDRQFAVLHLPGHSPGSIGLFEERTGILFAGDAVYDGPLIYEGPGTDLCDYTATLERLKALPVSVVHGGHDPSFGRARLVEICEAYLARWDQGPRLPPPPLAL